MRRAGWWFPKALRQALGLKPGQLLEIRGADGRLEIEIAPTPMHLKRRGKGVVADTRRVAATAAAYRAFIVTCDRRAVPGVRAL